MGCGCKSDTKNSQTSKSNLKTKDLDNKITKNKYFSYVFKTLFFLLTIPFTILILPYVFYILYKTIVLSKDNNLISDLSKIFPKRSTRKNDEENDEEYGDDDELVYEEYEYGKDYDDVAENLIDVELIDDTQKISKK
jgi:hypothetical protein